MNFADDSPQEFSELELNVIPLIDVLFCLLMFLMVSTTFARAGSVKVNLPSAKGAAASAADSSLTLTIKQDGSLLLNSKPTDRDSIEKLLSEQIQSGKDQSLIIQADKAVNHGTVVELMGAAHRAGIQKLAISATDTQQ